MSTATGIVKGMVHGTTEARAEVGRAARRVLNGVLEIAKETAVNTENAGKVILMAPLKQDWYGP